MAIRFFGANGFSAEVEQKYVEWLTEQCVKAVAKQKTEIKPDDPFYSTYLSCWEIGFPYTGAIGGEVTFMITPTGLGDIFKVKHAVTGEEIDLTDYENW